MRGEGDVGERGDWSDRGEPRAKPRDGRGLARGDAAPSSGDQSTERHNFRSSETKPVSRCFVATASDRRGNDSYGFAPEPPALGDFGAVETTAEVDALKSRMRRRGVLGDQLGLRSSFSTISRWNVTTLRVLMVFIKGCRCAMLLYCCRMQERKARLPYCCADASETRMRLLLCGLPRLPSAELRQESLESGTKFKVARQQLLK